MRIDTVACNNIDESHKQNVEEKRSQSAYFIVPFTESSRIGKMNLQSWNSEE